MTFCGLGMESDNKVATRAAALAADDVMRPRANPPLPFEPDRLLDRARQFRRVVGTLEDMDGAEPNWPKCFLLGHAIELAIKAYIESRELAGIAPPSKLPQHDLLVLYDHAVKHGLKHGLASDAQVRKDLQHLAKIHKSHYARYPRDFAMPVALISQFDSLVDALLEAVERAIRH